jgi:hypothetical protein
VSLTNKVTATSSEHVEHTVPVARLLISDVISVRIRRRIINCTSIHCVGRLTRIYLKPPGHDTCDQGRGE